MVTEFAGNPPNDESGTPESIKLRLENLVLGVWDGLFYMIEEGILEERGGKLSYHTKAFDGKKFQFDFVRSTRAVTHSAWYRMQCLVSDRGIAIELDKKENRADETYKRYRFLAPESLDDCSLEVMDARDSEREAAGCEVLGTGKKIMLDNDGEENLKEVGQFAVDFDFAIILAIDARA